MRRVLSLILTVIVSVGIMSFYRNDVSAYDEEKEYWKSFSSTYYYEQLSGKDKIFYERLDEAYLDSLVGQENYDENGITIDISDLDLYIGDASYIRLVYDLVADSNPVYFFLTGNLGFHYEGDDFKIVALTVYLYPEYWDYWDRFCSKNVISDVFDQYLELVPSDALPEEKEKIIHDEMCKRITYRTYTGREGSRFDQSIYGACKGKCVCAGYAKLFEALMNKLGVTCIYQDGTNHAWNMINLHGYWFCVDVTNDDQIGTHYKFYNCKQIVFSNGLVSPSELYAAVAPETYYDDLDEGSSLKEYSPRYFDVNGYKFFVINDYDDENGRMAVCISSDSADMSSVDYNGKSYAVTNAA